MKKQKRLITILVVVALIILMQAVGINFLAVFNEAEKIDLNPFMDLGDYQFQGIDTDLKLDEVEVEESDIQGGDSEQ